MDKKVKLGILAVIMSIVLLGFFWMYNENKTLKESNDTLKLEKQIMIDNNETYEYLNSLTVDTFEKKIKNKDDLFVYIGNSQCSDCSEFSKILEKKVKGFPLTDSLSLVDITTIHSDKERWLAFKERYKFDQTPSFILFQDGKIKSMIQWDEQTGLSEDDFQKWLNDNESYIRELENKV